MQDVDIVFHHNHINFFKITEISDSYPKIDKCTTICLNKGRAFRMKIC